jgi:hypothetical protein
LRVSGFLKRDRKGWLPFWKKENRAGTKSNPV